MAIRKFATLVVALCCTHLLSSHVVAGTVSITLDVKNTYKQPVEGVEVNTYFPNFSIANVGEIAEGMLPAHVEGPGCVTDRKGFCIIRVPREYIDQVIAALSEQESYIRTNHQAHSHEHHEVSEGSLVEIMAGAHDTAPIHESDVASATVNKSVVGKLALKAKGYLDVEIMDVNYAGDIFQPVILERGGHMDGQVQDAKGNLYSHIRVFLDREPDLEEKSFQLFVPPEPIVTKEDGRFSWRDLPSGNYVVHAEIMPKRKTELVANDEGNLVVIKESHISSTVLLLEPLNKVRGEIVFSGRVPEYAEIRIIDVGNDTGGEENIVARERVKTDPLDATPFVVEGVPKGHFVLQLTAAGYPLTMGDDTLTVDSYGKIIDSGVSLLSQGFNISGLIVKESTGLAVSHASLSLYSPTQGGINIANTRSNEDGGFVMKNIRPGVYSISVSAPPMVRVTKEITVVDGINYYEFGMSAGRLVTGLWEKPDTLANDEVVEIMLVDPEFDIVTRSHVDNDGSFSFDNVPEGEYQIYIPMFDQIVSVSIPAGEGSFHIDI